ncbi:hypothetical protein VPNG_00188 [Cytospora leucostoma]|uniref:Uncharacterized protein n=1 Tax=Cytospora leucostoma TaxID=1230097 RepID=A0A423XMY6_9PEZI|nr:hypothetical protein VPNG_00188 [Cytospora leucostoma]
MTETADVPSSPVAQSLLRLVPIVTTFTISMCHFDQHLILSSFLPAAAPPHNSPRVLAHVMREYVQGVLPVMLAMDFLAYGCFAANVYYRVRLWRWYGVGLVFFLSHLANAPYSWKRLVAIQYGEDGTAEKDGKTAQRDALEEFVRMNKMRLVLTELPLLAIAVAGAL